MVRKEIEDETDRLTEKSKRISPVPIHLSIYSPNGKEFILYIFIFWWDMYPAMPDLEIPSWFCDMEGKGFCCCRKV